MSTPSRSRLSDVDAPAPPSPPSPVLSAAQSWTSGEIPIYLDATATLQHSSSIGTFGQPVRHGAAIASRRSYSSFNSDPHSSSSSSLIPPSSSFSTLEEYWYCTDQRSVLSLSSYLTSASLYGGPVEDPPFRYGHPKSFDHLASVDRSALQPHPGTNRHEHSELDVPITPSSTFLLSLDSSAVSEHVTDTAAHIPSDSMHIPSPRHPRAVSAPLRPPDIDVLDATLQPHDSQLQPPPPTPSRSTSTPHGSVPPWLLGMHVELWIDQEGFRAIQPRLDLSSFSSGTGTNTLGEPLDVAEFTMRTQQTWYFHYAPLDGAPVLRRVTVNGDMHDYISRQAALVLKANDTYAVESTEDKGRVAWKFEYRVEDRREPGTGKIIEGEKRFTPLRFVCNPAVLSAEQGKKVRLLQFVRKSVTPKLQSVRVGPGSGTRVVRLARGDDEKRAQDTLKNDNNPVAGQHIVPPAVLNAMFPPGACSPEDVGDGSGGLMPPPRGGRR